MGLSAIKLVSGGQTGADRAALDFAIEHGLPGAFVREVLARLFSEGT